MGTTATFCATEVQVPNLAAPFLIGLNSLFVKWASQVSIYPRHEVKVKVNNIGEIPSREASTLKAVWLVAIPTTCVTVSQKIGDKIW